jgi:hypothetical protein
MLRKPDAVKANQSALSIKPDAEHDFKKMYREMDAYTVAHKSLPSVDMIKLFIETVSARKALLEKGDVQHDQDQDLCEEIKETTKLDKALRKLNDAKLVYKEERLHRNFLPVLKVLVEYPKYAQDLAEAYIELNKINLVRNIYFRTLSEYPMYAKRIVKALGLLKSKCHLTLFAYGEEDKHFKLLKKYPELGPTPVEIFLTLKIDNILNSDAERHEFLNKLCSKGRDLVVKISSVFDKMHNNRMLNTNNVYAIIENRNDIDKIKIQRLFDEDNIITCKFGDQAAFDASIQSIQNELELLKDQRMAFCMADSKVGKDSSASIFFKDPIAAPQVLFPLIKGFLSKPRDLEELLPRRPKDHEPSLACKSDNESKNQPIIENFQVSSFPRPYLYLSEGAHRAEGLEYGEELGRCKMRNIR